MNFVGVFFYEKVLPRVFFFFFLIFGIKNSFTWLGKALQNKVSTVLQRPFRDFKLEIDARRKRY